MSDPAGDTRALPEDVVAALRQGHKIVAIKRLREVWGVDLKEAKDHIDRFMQADPLLRQKLQASSLSGARGCLFWFVVLVFIGFGVYQLLSGR